MDAPWRRAAMGHWDLMSLIVANGTWNPIWLVPYIDACVFRIDWLHCADQGCAADYIGNLLWLVQAKLPEANVKARVTNLWMQISDEYKAREVADRLQNLTPLMIKQDKKGPKLRCSGAQCRALVPIALHLAQKHLDARQPLEQAALVGMQKLDQCYQALSQDSIFSFDVLEKCSVEFALQYVALDKFHPDSRLWKIKPKLHLFLELCSVERTRPALCWNYRDEDFGGSVARLARRRGGLLSATSFSRNLIDTWRMQPMIRVV